MTFGDLLRKLRERAGVTQAKLAQDAGVPIGTLRNLEQGHRSPSAASLFRLADALGIGADSFAQCEEFSLRARPRRKGAKGS